MKARMKRTALSVAMAVALLSLTSCIVTSKNPLSSREEAKMDRRLLGVWYEEGETSGEDAYAMILPFEKNLLKVVYVWYDQLDAVMLPEPNVLVCIAFVSRIGAESYLNLGSCIQPGAAVESTDSYILMHYRIKKHKQLEISFLDTALFAKVVKAGSLEGTVSKELLGGVELTGSTENLAKFVKENADTEDRPGPLTFKKVFTKG